jgi:pimeloyl-ACP methyl ester carboxylesterase
MQFIVEGYPAYAYTGGRPFDPGLPAVLFVHGAAFDHSVWQWQSRYFAHHGFSVLAVDLPAHGRSPGTARATIPAFAGWIAAFLESADLGKAHLVGHSMGSLIALETALGHRSRLATLTLIGTAMPMAVGEPFIAAARDHSPAALDMEAVWGHTRHAQLAASAVPGVSLLGASRSLNDRSAPGVLHADLNACHAYQADVAKVRALDIPTLVVGGTRDQMTPLKAGQALAREIPGARFVALEAGHSMMSEAPRALVAALRGHLGAQ